MRKSDYRMVKTLIRQKAEMERRNRKRIKGRDPSIQADAKKRHYS